jgi:hypothetical protein
MGSCIQLLLVGLTGVRDLGSREPLSSGLSTPSIPRSRPRLKRHPRLLKQVLLALDGQQVFCWVAPGRSTLRHVVAHNLESQVGFGTQYALPALSGSHLFNFVGIASLSISTRYTWPHFIQC